MTQALFIGGTASHVGKSWFTAAFCRLLANRDLRVAPFKAQNMSNNSFPCIEGGEIGRSQAMQAEACGVPPMADMNPVLLKPNSSTGSQVVVQGKVWRSVEASEYYTHSQRLFDMALESYKRLAREFDWIVCEGAGSVAEVNLFDRDITNLRLAERVGARSVLVADIERGGVFGSLVGTMELLPPRHRALIRAFAVNRFRGDPALFDRGVAFLEERLGIPCLGVFPWTREIALDEEDSLAIDNEPPERTGAPPAVAVVRLPHISNFTDFHAIGPVSWISKPGDVQYKVVFLPGTKNTIDDLRWLREQGLEEWLRRQHTGGAWIAGICGGYQMLGERVDDPHRLESRAGGVDGLGWLPVKTVLESPKVTRTVEARTPAGTAFRAYEIHMGRTVIENGAAPFATLSDGSADGCRGDRVFGTYLHGAFDDPDVVRETLGIASAPSCKNAMYNRLAEWLVTHSRPRVLETLLS